MIQLNLIAILLAISIFLQINYCATQFPTKCLSSWGIPKSVTCVNATIEDFKEFINITKFDFGSSTKITFSNSIFEEITGNELLFNEKAKDLTYNFYHNQIKKFHIDAMKYIDVLENNAIDMVTTSKNIINYQEYISTISLTKNRIGSIDVKVFTNVSIHEIDLSSTGLVNIKSETFSNMHDVFNINLANNNLTRLHKYTFVNLSKTINIPQEYENNFHTLDLSHNKLNTLDPYSFYNLGNIKMVDLQYNNLTSLSGPIFAQVNLTTLLLSHNQINYISVKFFENIETLLVLKLTDNQIKTLPSRFFLKLRNLGVLWLFGNPISCIETDAFDGLHEVVEYYGLRLGELHVPIIRTGAFNGLRKITRLDLSNWNVTKIETRAFTDLTKLKVLNLRNNQLTEIIPGTFYGLEQIDVIELSYNRLTRLTKDMFEGLNGTKFLSVLEYEDKNHQLITNIKDLLKSTVEFGLQLKLKHNAITTIESDSFTYLANLKTLDLSENQIQHLSIGTFKGLKFVVKLDLHQNGLTVLENEVLYPLVRLADLNLAENLLETFDVRSMIEHLINNTLKTINLNHNQWKCNALRLMISLLTEKKVDFTSSAPEYFDSHNVHGIRCIPSKDDDIEYRLTHGDYNARQTGSDVSPELLAINYQRELAKNSKILVVVCIFSFVTSLFFIALYVLRNKSYFYALRYQNQRNAESTIELCN